MNARTGQPLWKFKVGSGVVGAPITYRGPDGRQYVAVYSGIGGDWVLLSGDVGRTTRPTFGDRPTLWTWPAIPARAGWSGSLGSTSMAPITIASARHSLSLWPGVLALSYSDATAQWQWIQCCAATGGV